MTFVLPYCPAIFFPLNTLPGNWHWPIDPGALCDKEFPCVASCVLKLCLLTTPEKPFPFDIPDTSTLEFSANPFKESFFASFNSLNWFSETLNSVKYPLFFAVNFFSKLFDTFFLDP